MQQLPPQLDRIQDASGTWLRAQGAWTAAVLGQRSQWGQVQRMLSEHVDAQGWDLRAAQALDHVGAQVLWTHWQRRWPERLQASPAQRAMLERIAALGGALPAPVRERGLGYLISRLGRLVLRALGHMQMVIGLIGQLALDVLQVLRAPHKAPWRDLGGHVYNMGATALPITALVGFLIGVVLAYLVALQLRQFGADAYVVDILGISLVRELGPLLAAILVAGRSGSAITAQIGVMRVTEELDAMQVMGIRHGFRLVLPRAMALALTMPLVALWTTLAALVGGILAVDLTLGMSAAYFVQSLPSAVDVDNLTLAMAKSVVFGIAIALIGCHWGLRVKPNTQSLGQGTTASVVTAITVVIMVDAVFAIVFKDVGM